MNDTNDDYQYDENGNMIADENKGIGLIKYNHLNLPTLIDFGGGKNIQYFYNASGVKLKKVVMEETSALITDYLGGFQYLNGNLQFFFQPEGYVNIIKHGVDVLYINYVYNYTDHLGNIRLSYGIDPETNVLKILEENHYYPFGLKHTNYNSDIRKYTKETDPITQLLKLKILPPTDGKPLEYKYKFQGQERQDELGLNWDSFKYRNYDPAIGRFMSIDPLTEEYTDWSPYVFSGNRVIDAREIEGLEPHLLNDNLQEAARNFSEQYNGYSIENSVEVATQFYQTQEGCYAYANPLQFTPGMADPSQANDIPEGSVPVGDAHTHGSEKGSVVVQPNVTSGGPMTSEKNPIAMSKLTLNDFGTGPYQNQVVNGSNAPSGDDKQAVAHPNTGSSTFQRSYVFTPSGLSYSGTLSKDGKSIDYQINYNLSKTTPSQSNSALNINNVPSSTTPVYIPLQGKLNFGK
jgi:RHS repeat-associated protein